MKNGSRGTEKVIEQLMEERTPLTDCCMKIEKDDSSAQTCSKADGKYCSVYAYPAIMWGTNDCLMADDFLRIKTEEQKKAEKIRLGQQKQRKGRR